MGTIHINPPSNNKIDTPHHDFTSPLKYQDVPGKKYKAKKCGLLFFFNKLRHLEEKFGSTLNRFPVPAAILLPAKIYFPPMQPIHTNMYPYSSMSAKLHCFHHTS
jgi:hypothetical protein